MDRGATVLVVDDDQSLVGLVRVALQMAGHEVTVCHDGDAALRAVSEEEPDVVLLDVMLPGEDGHEVADRLRAVSDAPIVFITARTDPSEAALALRRGGDDYVRKPFGLEELVARVEAVLRRRRQAGGDELRVGDLWLDEATFTARLGDDPVALTVTEYRLLRELVRQRNRIVERSELLVSVWGADVDGGALETTISRLRRKLDGEREDGDAAQLLRTRRGFGYGIFAKGQPPC